MPWYGWLTLGVGVTLALAAIAFRVLRASRRGRRFLSLSTRGKIAFGRALLADPLVPLPAKAMLFLVVAYLAMPFDLIPDFIPVAGQLDDMLIVILGIGLLILTVPRDRFEVALRGAERDQERRILEQALPTGPSRENP